MIKSKKIVVKNISVGFIPHPTNDYISLTDIARYRDNERTNYIIQNWMRTRNTVDFLGLWEKLHNPNFNSIEFDAFRNEAGSNSFSLTPQRWIEKTNAVGLVSKAGRYGGGTYAHKDLAFEFASWISPEFKLYLIKEFQRLKEEENERLLLGWDIKRTLTKLNYKIHTDAIKENLIPGRITKEQANMIFATEADLLNKALFGMTAQEWRDRNPKKEGNMRDYADVIQLVCLANLEALNAEFIRQSLPQGERLNMLNEIAIIQIRSLLNNPSVRKLK